MTLDGGKNPYFGASNHKPPTTNHGLTNDRLSGHGCGPPDQLHAYHLQTTPTVNGPFHGPWEAEMFWHLQHQESFYSFLFEYEVLQYVTRGTIRP